MAGPNARLEKFLAEHVVSSNRCSCGWDISKYDIEPYEWETDTGPARRRAWIAHVQRIWRDAHGLGKIQQATACDPNGDEVVFDMEPGHDRLSETPTGLGRAYRGEYRYADYEPPPRDPDNCAESITCEEAGCRNPHCLGGHFSLTLSVPAACAGCHKEFEEGQERIMVAMRAPRPQVLTEGATLATTAAYHKACEPSEDELRQRADELWPEAEPVAAVAAEDWDDDDPET